VVPDALRKFIRLPSRDRAVLARTILTLGAARLAIWILPFPTSRRLLVGERRPGPPTLTPQQVRWAMGHAQRIIPQATCLPQALAAESLLARGGIDATMQIGVMKTAAGQLTAHAWVESGGRIVVGDLPGGVGVYTRLPTLPQVWPESRRT
jgi:hypothetical protein